MLLLLFVLGVLLLVLLLAVVAGSRSCSVGVVVVDGEDPPAGIQFGNDDANTTMSKNLNR